jgi:uncharacterized membrane protein
LKLQMAQIDVCQIDRGATSSENRRLPIQVFGGVVLASLVLMLGLTYGLDKDLTLAPRFSFIYFPAAIILIGASLYSFKLKNFSKKSRQNVNQNCRFFLKIKSQNYPAAIVLGMATIGSLTVASNLGYLQTHRSDRMANLIYETSHTPVLIATTHRHHGDTGRMMGLAWEFHHLDRFKPEWIRPPQFLLAHNDGNPTTIDNPTTTLKQVVGQSLRPIDVWLINFDAQIDLAGKKCDRDEDISIAISEYRYKLYHCLVN